MNKDTAALLEVVEQAKALVEANEALSRRQFVENPSIGRGILLALGLLGLTEIQGLEPRPGPYHEGERAREREMREREQMERGMMERERLERERLERERLERDLIERERIARLERERIERDRIERERMERERLAQMDRREMERGLRERERRPPVAGGIPEHVKRNLLQKVSGFYL